VIADNIAEVLFKMRIELRDTRHSNPELYEAMQYHIAEIGRQASQIGRIERERADQDAATAMLPAAIAAGAVVPFRRRAG
jgi:hypothetical protein